MSEKEKAIKLLDTVPPYKLGYVIAYIQGITADEDADDTAYEETEPDEWDLKMIDEAQKINDGTRMPFEKILAKDGLTYADIQN